MSILSADIISECVTFAETVGRSGKGSTAVWNCTESVQFEAAANSSIRRLDAAR